MQIRDRLGALAERDFRLLFASTTVDAIGDGVATIALVFAVLQVSSSAVSLGVVLAGRQIAQTAIVLAAGVWSDRLPRHLVLVGVSTTQATVQACTAALLLSGHASIPALAGLQVLYGLADGFVIPASTGLIPETVSADRLQDANALLGLARNTISVLGPALGGVIVALGSPGTALAIDAASFAGAALLLARLRVPRRPARAARSFAAELKDGWAEFSSRTWLWTTVGLFGVGNLFGSFYFVLGPVVAKQSLGGAPAWAALVSCFGAGSIAGGIAALRFRPARPLWWCVAVVVPILGQQMGVALRLPLPVIAALAVIAGIGLALHLTLWFTVFQREVPPDALSRVSAYDSLGSFVLTPIGSALAGVIAAAAGTRATLLGAVAVELACLGTMLLLPSVRAIRSPDRAPEPAVAA